MATRRPPREDRITGRQQDGDPSGQEEAQKNLFRVRGDEEDGEAGEAKLTPGPVMSAFSSGVQLSRKQSS
jgi:hypothetical protein